VDDAIIDAATLFRRMRENRLHQNPDPPLRVVCNASHELRIPIVYATLIILVVFGPIFFFTGVEGRIFTPLGLAFTISLFASLVVSVTLTPVLCSFLLIRVRHREGREREEESFTVRKMKEGYERVLIPLLRHPGWLMGIALILFLLSVAMIPFMGSSFLPEFHEGNFILAVSSLPGTSLPESMRLGYRITQLLRKYPEVVSVAQRAGRAELDEDA